MAITLYNQNTPRIRGVLFDMDGLVLDTEKLYTRFWMEACRFYGFPMTRDQALKMRAANARLSEENLRSFFGPTVDYKKCRAKRIELMDAFIEENGVETKPGIFELLDALDTKGIPAAITSSAPKERIEKHLASVNLKHRFAAICSGHEVPHGKPAPDIYLHGAASLGLPPESCLALEDAPTGILAAHRAGCVTVMVPDLDQPDERTQKLLHARADSLLDVIKLL
ncbi:MAG: HAD family phosphatase [Ruminococcaceae bacterium]|nr:HAD family phosphatase [Oscillospiraceae bacterium]